MTSLGPRAGYASVAIAAVLWGTFSLFFRPAERMSHAELAPATEAFAVFAVVFAVTAPFAWQQGRKLGRRPARGWAAVAFTGVGDALNAMLFFWAMQTTSLSIAVLSHYLAPVLIALGAPIFLGERMQRVTWIALALAFTGLGLLLEPWRAGTTARAAFTGAALGVGSAFCYATNVIVFKRVQHLFLPLEVLAWHMPTGLVLLFLCVPRGGFALGPEVAGLLVAAGLIPGALAGVLFLRGLARVPASRASVFTLLEPLVAVLIGVLVWGERPTLVAAFGALLVLSGAWLVLKTEAPLTV
jgi:RarD protein